MKKTVTIALIVAVQLLLFGLLTGKTLATEQAEHILTYKNQKLVWDANTEVNNQVAQLRLFSDSYENVKSNEKVVAPGTEGSCVVRLKNESANEIEYKAVISKKDDTPIHINNSTEDIVVKTGKVAADSVTNLDIEWKWIFDEEDERDTVLGNKELLDNASVYLEIQVTDDGRDVPVQTGDMSAPVMLVLIATTIISCILIVMVILWEDKRKEQ